VRYRDPALERLHARRLAVADPVFTRAGNERAMGRPVDGTAMFDAVCRPLGVADFHGVFARTPHGDAMLFVAHGRRAGRRTLLGEAAVPLLRVLAPALGAAVALLRAGEGGPPWGGRVGPDAVGPHLPDPPTLRARFGLTPREADVAHGLARGWTREQIAAAAGMRPATARHHTEAVFRKLGVRTRGAVGLALLGAAPGAPTSHASARTASSGRPPATTPPPRG
jgi:DNA-binding CsgD family transcriptional regulator